MRPRRDAHLLRLGKPEGQRHAQPDSYAVELSVRQPLGRRGHQRVTHRLPLVECDRLAVAQRKPTVVGLALA